jgi:hypothetical protein
MRRVGFVPSSGTVNRFQTTDLNGKMLLSVSPPRSLVVVSNLVVSRVSANHDRPQTDIGSKNMQRIELRSLPGLLSMLVFGLSPDGAVVQGLSSLVVPSQAHVAVVFVWDPFVFFFDFRLLQGRALSTSSRWIHHSRATGGKVCT